MLSVGRTLLVSTLAFSLAWSWGPANAHECGDADPAGVTAKVFGDFQLLLDPSDPAQSLLYVAEVNNGLSDVVVAEMDSGNGKIVPGTLTTIANNFFGYYQVNGPQFVLPPGLGVGVLYRARDGVHGVFRPAVPKAWNDFSLDVNGAPAGKSPPVLVSTLPGSYEQGGMPLGEFTYGMLDGQCSLRCFANMRSGTATDAAPVVQKDYNLTIPTKESIVQAERDGVLYMEACTNHAAANGECGIYEITINDAGGFVPNSLHELIALPASVGPRPGRVPLDAARHPVTGTTVFFLAGQHEIGQTVDVYEEKVVDGPLTLVASVPVVHHSDHYRIRSSPSELVLDFLIRHGEHEGSYTIAVTAANGQLQVGSSKEIVDAADGTKVAYLPVAGRFAYFYRTTRHPSSIERCFFTP